ncbi:hypothetical protein GCM10027062_13220 [Nocardioides hungaricus]
MRAPALVVAAVLPLALLGACSGALDQANTVQTRLNRIDQVTSSKVATPSADTGAAITVTYNDASSVRELSRLIAAIDRVADEQDYPSYRLDLVPAENDADRLTVDDSFAGSSDEAEVLGNWLTTTAAMLGSVRYRFEPGLESIELDSGAGILPDVGEASRIGYGFDDTVWTFRTGDSAFVVAGRVSPTDVTLFQGTARTVASGVLPAPASTWRLERRDGHVLLDLRVAFPGGSVAPDRLTIGRYGEDVERLAGAAMTAVGVAGLPVTMRLVNPAPDGDDVFGYWSSDDRPVRGRDPLMRGWDAWLVQLAQQRT